MYNLNKLYKKFERECCDMPQISLFQGECCPRKAGFLNWQINTEEMTGRYLYSMAYTEKAAIDLDIDVAALVLIHLFSTSNHK